MPGKRRMSQTERRALSIAKELKGTKVPRKYQGRYGKRYSTREAQQAGWAISVSRSKGWRKEPARHSLAARGVGSGRLGPKKSSGPRSVPPKSGAVWITRTGHGSTMEDAYDDVVREDGYRTGYSEYSGNMATTRGFVDLTDEMKRLGMTPKRFVEHVLEDEDYAYKYDVEKWGKAGGIKVREGVYVFFGWASM